jgi:putative SOS response-associated peptidase YedK
MCAHYFAYTEGDIIEIRKIIEEWNKTVFKTKPVSLATGEIYPGCIAPIAAKDGLRPMKWGYPHSSGKVNRHARSETAAVKFREDMAQRRCIIPATHFYEYAAIDDQLSFLENAVSRTARKVKYQFTLPGSAPFNFAGLYSYHPVGESVITLVPHFVIMTMEANSSVADIHDRMPVVLHDGELSEWLIGGKLSGVSPIFERKAV